MLLNDVNKLRSQCNPLMLCVTVDWMIADMLAVRQGSIGHIRYILKNSLRWVPLYGYYFRQVCICLILTILGTQVSKLFIS